MELLINHIGYDLHGKKLAILQTSGDRTPGEFSVVDRDSGEIVYSGTLQHRGEVPGWKGRLFWTADFSAVSRPGRYAVILKDGDRILWSESFCIRENLLQHQTLSDVLYYFKSMRSSGVFDRRDREVPFYGSREGTVDVHGGWYDASGDVSKYLSHLSYANYMNPQQIPMVVWCLLDGLAGLEQTNLPLSEELRRRFQEEAAFGADFLVRMQDPDGCFYMTVFDRWSKKLEERMICAYATQQGIRSEAYQAGYRQGGGAAIAALARSAAAGFAGDYGPEDYLAAAEQGFAHLEEHNLSYLDDGKENIIDDYCALLAAAELFWASGKERYLNAARRRASSLAERLSADENYEGWWRADDAGEIPYFHAAEAGMPVLALIRFLECCTGATDSTAATLQMEAFLLVIRKSLEFELGVTSEVNNPFGYARQYVKALNGSRRTSFFYPHDNWSGYWWQGENARLASLASAAEKASRLFTEDPDFSSRLKVYAEDQLSWILGLNPFDVCMLHGHGRNNPFYEKGYYNGPGGIANGITSGFSDEADIAFLPEEAAGRGDQRWRWSEQWIPHAAWFLHAVSNISSRS